MPLPRDFDFYQPYPPQPPQPPPDYSLYGPEPRPTIGSLVPIYDASGNVIGSTEFGGAPDYSIQNPANEPYFTSGSLQVPPPPTQPAQPTVAPQSTAAPTAAPTFTPQPTFTPPPPPPGPPLPPPLQGYAPPPASAFAPTVPRFGRPAFPGAAGAFAAPPAPPALQGLLPEWLRAFRGLMRSPFAASATGAQLFSPFAFPFQPEGGAFETDEERRRRELQAQAGASVVPPWALAGPPGFGFGPQ